MISIITTLTDPVSQFAEREFIQFLSLVRPEQILVNPENVTGRKIRLEVRPEQNAAIIVDHDATETLIAGQTPTGLLHGVYRFLETMGYLFTIRGPIAPESPSGWRRPFHLAETPVITERGIRQHINFPMDITGYPLADALAYIRNLARLKLNFLTVHLYNNMGWHTFNYHGFSIGESPNATLYYGEQHAISTDPVVRAGSPNKAVFCIPELEPIYRTTEQRAYMHYWLQRVLQCAKECGMTVVLSVEAFAPSSDTALAVTGETPLPALYAHVTAAAVAAVLEQYPEADGIEIISSENEHSWPAPATVTEALQSLRAEYNVALPELSLTDEENTADIAAQLVSAVRALQVGVDAFALLAADPLLADRRQCCATYTTHPVVWRVLPVIAEHLLPPALEFAALPAHGARTVAVNLDRAPFSPAFLARSRVYSWCEFDGLMYLQQNECEGLHRCFEFARQFGDSDRSAALVVNHWRNAENEISISYLAETGYYGCTPGEFNLRYLSTLVGGDAAFALALALSDLDAANAFAVDNLFNMGFCYRGCWLSPPRLAWVGWKPQDIATYRGMLSQIIRKIRGALPQVRGTIGLERCRFLLNRLEASRIHCDVITHLRVMREMVAEFDPGQLPVEKQTAFREHAAEAAALVEAYIAHSAALLPDRGGEGTLVSYEHVMLGVINKALQDYVADENAVVVGDDSDIAPPPPAVV